MTGFAVRGTLLHTPRRDAVEVIADALVEVDADGTITAVGPWQAASGAACAEAGRLLTLGPREVLIPGMVDLHVHAPQWPQAGLALDVPLEEWLLRHTFPLEARYADPAFARTVYADLVASLLAEGTTTSVYYGSIHVEATLILAETCLALGQRAIIGKVAMDDPDLCPDTYRDADAASAIAGTRAVIAAIRDMAPGPEPLVRPAIIPRFLPSSTPALLAGLGGLAGETGAHVQTHCSESPWEVAHGAARFGCSDAEVLDRYGLLRPHAILAHANHSDGAERALIRARGAAIAHCPLSNAYFADAILPTREILDEGTRIGLGSDIAGGYSPSLFENARMAVTASRMRGGDGLAIDAVEAFWLATAGGGEAIGLPVGRFAPGCQFDALALSTARRIAADPTPGQAIEWIVRRAAREDIGDVWVAGRRVKARRAP